MRIDLENGARFMVYEYDMFIASCYLLANYPGPSQIFRNLALEAALLHARNLADFLHNGGGHPDDIKAARYFDRGDGSSTDALAEHRIRLNKRLTHASYKRASTAQQWNVKAIHAAIVEAWSEFVRRLATAHPERAFWFETAERPTMLTLPEEWDPQWVEAESALEWWEPEDLVSELDQLLQWSTK